MEKTIFRLMVVATLAATVNSQAEHEEHFDLENDHGLIEALDHITMAARHHVSENGQNAPVVFHIVTHQKVALFDAMAPYTENAVGMITKIPRRPKSEFENEKNRNIAMLYATYQAGVSLVPKAKMIYEEMLIKNLGRYALNHLEDTDLTTPEGIGNAAGKGAAEAAHSRGMNSLGDFSGTKQYKKKPYSTTVPYKPVNSPYDYKIKEPSKWQPAMIPLDGGAAYVAQQFVVPHFQFVKPFFTEDMESYTVKPHGRLDASTYKETTDEVIEVMANITEKQRVLSELFNDKYTVTKQPYWHMYGKKNLSQVELLNFDVGVYVGAYDTLIAVWKEKARFNAVRPFSAIRYLYEYGKIKGYGGPHQGLVEDMPVDEWDSYLPVSDHPEYPSATAAVCGLQAEFLRLWFGEDDTHGFALGMRRGKSRYEPHITPKEHMLRVEFDTWTEYEDNCALSRLWSGVHFKDAVLEGQQLGRKFGKNAVDFVKRHINGV